MEAPITDAVSPRSAQRRFTANRSTGNLFERIAARWLRRRGYRRVAAQTRVRGVEIDLVMARRGFGALGPVTFVEVRGRTVEGRAPRNWLSAEKQRRLARAAEGGRYHGRAIEKLVFVEVIGPAPAWLRRWPVLAEVLPLRRWQCAM